MRRYWIEKKYFDQEQIRIEGESFHHICDVCRLAAGDKFEILCDGQAYFVQLESVGKKSAIAKILEERKISEIPKPYIHLCVSVSKFQTMDTIVEKAVELGVFALHPFVSDYSFIREKNSERLSDKLPRWQRIVKSATQQSGRGDLMEIAPMAELKELLKKMNQTEFSAGLFPYEGESAQTVRLAIEHMKTKKPENVWLFVGSEGGFSTQEVQIFKEFGLMSSSLGDQVLRVETACLSLVSILKYELGQP